MSAVNSLKYLCKVETTVKAEATVRIRVRGTIIRIQITEARIRSIIRISRQEGTPDRRHPYFVIRLFSLSYVLVLVNSRCSVSPVLQSR